MIRWFVAGPHLVQVRHGRVVKAKKATWLVGKDLKTAKNLSLRKGLAFYEVTRKG